MAYNPLPIDNAVTAVIQVDESQHWVHLGQRFLACYTTAGLAAGSTANLSFVTPNTTQAFHAVFSYACNTEATFQIIEAPTLNTTGSGLLAINHNRTATNSASASVRCSASATNGTIVYQDRIGFSGGGPASPVGGASHDEYELILKQNSNYLFLCSAHGVGAVSMHLDWYEL